jgi:hypothetical protein
MDNGAELRAHFRPVSAARLRHYRQRGGEIHARGHPFAGQHRLPAATKRRRTRSHLAVLRARKAVPATHPDRVAARPALAFSRVLPRVEAASARLGRSRIAHGPSSRARTGPWRHKNPVPSWGCREQPSRRSVATCGVNGEARELRDGLRSATTGCSDLRPVVKIRLRLSARRRTRTDLRPARRTA